MDQDRIAATPAYKGVGGFQNLETPVFRNGQDLSSENVSASAIEFFPKQPGDSDASSNYTSKPFVGQREYFVAALSLEPSFQALRVDPNTSALDLVKFYNQLSHGRVVFESALGREKLLQQHISDYMELNIHEYSANAFEDSSTTAGFNEMVTFESTGPLVLPEPLVIGAQEVFELRVEFDATDAFPSESEWGTLDQGGVMQLLAKMQVAYEE
jgi:hypothetical protein